MTEIMPVPRNCNITVLPTGSLLAPFIEMGRVFARSGRFEKSAVDAFTAPEFMSKKQMRTYNLFGKYISRVFMGHIAKKLGCKEKLDARPFAE